MRLVFRIVFVTFLGLASTRAQATESAYCRKVEARAASDAALLMWPRVFAQGIRFPRNAPVDLGANSGNGLQLRLGLSYSLLDIYKGAKVLRVGDADCKQHESSADLEDILAHGIDSARLTALGEQARFLDAHRDEWRAMLERADSRLASHVITLIELDELRRHADALERKLVQVRGEIEQLEVHAVPLVRGSLTTMRRRYVERALRTDRELSSVRLLDAWQVQVTAGVIPESPVDWYGIAEINLNIGGILRAVKEHSYLASREDELRHARYELDARVREYAKQVRSSSHEAHRDLEVVERELGYLATSQNALGQSDAPNIAHARDTLTIERLSLDSDRTFLLALIPALSTLSEDDHAVD
jgi:hypothetical protein